MLVEQRSWTHATGWSAPVAPGDPISAQLLLVFGAREAVADGSALAELRRDYPGATMLGCTTAGEIQGVRVSDGGIVATAIHFEHTRVRAAAVELASPGDSRAAGERLAEALDCDDLRHVFVLSDGLKVNGSELVKGLTARPRASVAVTGGLSGDGASFERTLVWLDGPPTVGMIAAVGLCGERLRVGHGSMGGWDPFGPERVVTRSAANVLFELDGRPALDLYKDYLGEHAAGLPASGLLFPLSLRAAGEAARAGVVRTILAVDHAAGSMTFAGDLPEGSLVRLMKANFERLIDGATDAARLSQEPLGPHRAELAILISCVGRKLVLKQRVEEEVESVEEILGRGTPLTGFYSYGEISPFTPSGRCELHNQTMTITTLSER